MADAFWSPCWEIHEADGLPCWEIHEADSLLVGGFCGERPLWPPREATTPRCSNLPIHNLTTTIDTDMFSKTKFVTLIYSTIL